MKNKTVTTVDVASVGEPLILRSDLASEFPLYLYLSNERRQLLYSISASDLLSDEQVDKPLSISDEGVAFLLQNGVIPPPKTIYENVFILGIGDSAEIKVAQGKFEIFFKHEFPFLNAYRPKQIEMPPDKNTILKMLANAVISRVKTERPTFLFHSAGKDSNSVVLALARAGLQDAATLITHKSKGAKDESELSYKIAKKFGFKHYVLEEVGRIGIECRDRISSYFSHMPFPTTDSVSLAYPLYISQLPDLIRSNIIDGGGNDVYMGTPPSKRESFKFMVSQMSSQMSFLRSFVHSESYVSNFLKTPPEWCGMSGLSFADSCSIYPKSISVYPYWKNELRVRSNWDHFDLKTDLLTSVTASELHIRKVRNFAYAISANLILPWSNEAVAAYFFNLPEEYLFDRKSRRNKIILRNILQEEIGLNSDKIGKMGFSYDFFGVVFDNWSWVQEQIFECYLWDPRGVESLLNRLKRSANISKYSRKSVFAAKLIYRLLLISLWFNAYKGKHSK